LPLLGSDEIAGRGHRPNLLVHRQRLRQKGTEIVVEVPGIRVQREVIDVLVDVVEHRRFPLGEGRHLSVRATAGNQLDAGIDPLHGDGGLASEAAVLVGRLVP